MKKLLTYSALILSVCTALTMACPNCKEGFEAGSAQASIGDSYSMSVLFMLCMIFGVFAACAFLITMKVRKHNAMIQS